MITASFFRVEGPLSPRSSGHAAAWLAANAQYLSERLLRLSTAAVAGPAMGLFDSGAGHRLAWSALRGLSADRLRILGEEYHATFVAERIRDEGGRLLERARVDGHRIVLLSDGLDVVLRPLCEQLRADDLVCNRMEMRDDRATGRLVDPVVSRHLSGQWLRSYAATHGIDLTRSCAYGSSADDATLLSAIGRPCLVSPDRGLRQLAREMNWPTSHEDPHP